MIRATLSVLTYLFMIFIGHVAAFRLDVWLGEGVGSALVTSLFILFLYNVALSSHEIN